jgi:hypothetical protein
MNIGEEEEVIEVPVPVHPDAVPSEEPAPEEAPAEEPEEVPA